MREGSVHLGRGQGKSGEMRCDIVANRMKRNEMAGTEWNYAKKMVAPREESYICDIIFTKQVNIQMASRNLHDKHGALAETQIRLINGCKKKCTQK